jgi:hypothetical protein
LVEVKLVPGEVVMVTTDARLLFVDVMEKISDIGRPAKYWTPTKVALPSATTATMAIATRAGAIKFFI